MISASRRRTGLPGPGDSFQLHLRLARRAALDKRLLNGAVVALLASLAGLVFAPSLGAHALMAAAGFVLGAALPTPGSLTRALDSIREQAGLSYETALELRSIPEGEVADPYDFRTRVDERARLSVRDVRPRSPPAWWLPILVVAFGLLLLPGFAPSAANGGQPGFMSGSDPSGQSPATGEEAGDEETDVGLGDTTADRGTEPDGAGSDGPGDVPPAGQSASGEGDGSAPLSRFLDSLRERPTEAGDSRAQDASGEGQPEQSGSQAGDERVGGEEDPRRFELGDGSGDSNRELVAGTDDPDGETLPDGEGDAEGGEGQDDGEGPTPGTGPRNPFEQTSGPSEELGQELGGNDPAGDGEGLTPSADGGGEDGGDGSSGEGGGESTPAGTATSQSDSEPDVLRGVLTEGQESLLGTVLLPGRDEVELPAGVSFAQYAAAAEEALSEGDIPLEYQEILRRYFR